MKSIFASFFILCSLQGKAQQPDSVRKFIDSALRIMEQNSVFSKRVNWKNIGDTVYAITKNASNFKDAAPGIKYAFNALGDKHGWLSLNGEMYRNPDFVYDTSRISENISEAALNGARIYTGIVENKYAYISIPYFGGQTEEKMKAFAQKIQDSLFININESTKGIIIDLRLNAGGNMFPMFAGLSNVLGETDFGLYPAASGSGFEKSSITREGVSVNGKVITGLPRTCGDLSAHPVVIITGPVTASSGECLAAGFIWRQNTVLIGENTAGYTTANDGFRLHGKEYGIVLAVGYLRDRYGNIYVDDVKPDIQVAGGDNFFNREKDSKILAAIEWFSNQQ